MQFATQTENGLKIFVKEAVVIVPDVFESTFYSLQLRLIELKVT